MSCACCIADVTYLIVLEVHKVFGCEDVAERRRALFRDAVESAQPEQGNDIECRQRKLRVPCEDVFDAFRN